MSSLNVLVTNKLLMGWSGTEWYVRDLCLELLAQGHRPVVYSPQLGDLAKELLAATIPVTDDLATLDVAPDIIHGHHSLETLAALTRFPDTPAIFVCHDWSAWHDRPPRLKRVRRFVAVDETCRDRLTKLEGIPESQTEVFYNAVDLQRFQPRSPLPTRPERALVFSNYVTPSEQRVFAAACASRGIRCEGLGGNLARGRLRPDALLAQFDVVFAKGRCAWEALAVGAAVVVADASGAGPLVTAQELDRLRRANFGRRLLRQPLHEKWLGEQLDGYSASDASEVSRRVREEAPIARLVNVLVELYRQVIDEQAADGKIDRVDEYRELSSHWQWWGRHTDRYGAEMLRQGRRSRTLQRLLRWGRSLLPGGYR